MRFVQFSDAHLDSTIAGALNLPGEKRAAIRQDLRTAVARALALAAEHNVQLVLIPGDLFDHESLTPETTSFILEALSGAAPARVFITPGNHDSLRPGSPYRSDNWPNNVHVFTEPEFATVEVPDIGCSVTGVAHAHRGVTERLLSRSVAPGDGAVRILLFHGSRDGYRPADKENVIPFSDDELISQGFTYAAVGHYHSYAEIRDPEGRLLGSYSGCVQGRGLDETGEKCVLLGEIAHDGNVQLQRIEVATRRIVSVEVAVAGAADNAAICQRIQTAAATAGARDCDAVNVSLIGMMSPGALIDTSLLEASGSWFHVRVDRSRVRPDYNLDALVRESSASPVRSAFVRRMLELRDQAASDDEKRTLLDAIYYGLHALDGRRLEPRDVD